jgi:hypothetical protein
MQCRAVVARQERSGARVVDEAMIAASGADASRAVSSRAGLAPRLAALLSLLTAKRAGDVSDYLDGEQPP